MRYGCFELHISCTRNVFAYLFLSGTDKPINAMKTSMLIEAGKAIWRLLNQPEIIITQFGDTVSLKFQRLHPCFRGRPSHWRIQRQRQYCRPTSENPIWRLLNRKYCNLGLSAVVVHDRGHHQCSSRGRKPYTRRWKYAGML
jgi:hypothetical protein